MSQFTLNISDNLGNRTLVVDGSRTILEELRLTGSEVHAPCGGNGTCKRCGVTVTGDCCDLSGKLCHFEQESVLSCRYMPAGDLTIAVDTAKGSRVLTDAIELTPCGEGLGLAVDIGTTTVAAYIYDLATGKCLNTAGEMNAQRPYGGDVISRIGYASNPEGLDTLCRVIREQISRMADKLCLGKKDKISYISIAGNTVMEHIFANLSPESIGVAPFTPLSLFGEEYPASDFFTGFSDSCRLYLCPCVAGYVGGDITAGILSSGACDSEDTVLFIDIGTNGEMGIGDKTGFICCATAAGPTFEGAEIECGSPAQNGAINSVSTDMSYTVLGDAEPKSICGSGIIDAAAALLYNEELDESGRLEDEQYVLGGEVYISGKDIRKIQLAKAAIRAGIETLLARSGKKHADVSHVLIAGGFGAYMKIESACAIGLLPPAFLDKTRHVGNSAGKGAAMALNPKWREALKEITEKCKYEELSSSALFNDKYIDAMMFDEWEEVYDN